VNELSFFIDFDQLSHVQGPGHPERPARLERLRTILGNFPEIPQNASEPATAAELRTVHTASYVDRLLSLQGKSAVLDPDTRVGPTTIAAARSAAGCAIAAARSVFRGDSQRSFAIVRPPGHHAEAGQAMGFCYFNNVALMAEAALDEGAERVLIVDWDVHHGNGTQHSFEDRADVAVVNLHQWPFYPGSGALKETGKGSGRGFTVNCPLEAGAGDSDYLELFDRVVLPYAKSFSPEIILVSAGYDSHERDPLGAMNVTDRGFGQMAARLRSLADELCEGRLAATLEGGYDLDGLAGGVSATIEAWKGRPTPVEASTGASAEVEAIVVFHNASR
jgi:acetoin utilization deacetylase AcuC-like enzyme